MRVSVVCDHEFPSDVRTQHEQHLPVEKDTLILNYVTNGPRVKICSYNPILGNTKYREKTNESRTSTPGRQVQVFLVNGIVYRSFD